MAPGLGDGAAARDLDLAAVRVAQGGTLVDAASSDFVPAIGGGGGPAATPPAPSRIEIVTPNGYRVLVDAGVAAAALARVLAVLARA